MSLYFSRLTLNRDASARALLPLLNPRDASAKADTHHRLIWTVFSDAAERKRDFLWRYDGHGRFFTLSARPPRVNDLFQPPETKVYDPDLRRGDRLAFLLRANATKDRAGAKNDRRVDVVMDLLRAVPKEARASARMKLAQTAAEAWMARQGTVRGFALRRVVAEGYSTLDLVDDERKYRKRTDRPRLGILDLSGEIEIIDAALFLPALATGLGRAKAWGCGLMLIRRAR